MSNEPHYDEELGAIVAPEGTQTKKDADAVFDAVMEGMMDAVDMDHAVSVQKDFEQTMAAHADNDEEDHEFGAKFNLMRAVLHDLLEEVTENDEVPNADAQEELLTELIRRLTQDGIGEICKTLEDADDPRNIGTRLNLIDRITEFRENAEEGDA